MGPDDFPSYLHHFLLRKAYLLGQVGLLHKIKCKEVLWVACMKRSLRLHCNRELMVYWVLTGLRTCARTGGRFKVTQVTIDMWRAGCGKNRVPEIRTDHYTKTEESGPYCRSRSEEFLGTISCKALRGQHVELPLPPRAKGLWSHQVMLQGQKRPRNFILPTSCFLERVAAQALQSHQRVMCGDEPLSGHDPFL